MLRFKPACFPIAGLLACTLLVLVITPGGAVGDELVPSDSIVIHQVHTHNENGLLYLDATAAIILSTEVEEALEKGIQLSFATEIEVYSPRRFQLLPNKRLAYFEILKKLRYHALTKKFIVRNPASKTQKSFDTLRGALRYMGLYRNFPLIATTLSQSSPETMIRMRIRLLKDELPPLLYVKSYFPVWRISSDWYAWHLN